MARDPYYWYRSSRQLYARDAYTKVQEALKNGILIRPDHCEMCRVQCKPDAHHEDYLKPLEVKWLCDECHYRKVHHKNAVRRGNTRRHKHGELWREVFGEENENN